MEISQTGVQPHFDNRGGAFFGTALRGGLLQIVSLGFYRFWMLTDLRRHLWSSTRIDGDALEYTGRGKELLIGFLFAMAILAPMFFVYFLLGLEAKSYQAFASLPLYGFLYVFMQYASYRARRYRLSRTVWRGVRFWMEKGGWTYAFMSVGLGLVSSMTLGLYAPWRTAELERYKFARTRYGDLTASFEGTGRELFRAGILYWVLSAIVPFVAVGVSIWIFVKLQLFEADEPPPAAVAGLGAAVFLSFILIGVFYALYQAVEWRWFLNGVRIGGARVESAFPRGRLLQLYLLSGLSVIGVLLAFGAVVGGAAAVFGGRNLAAHFDPNDLMTSLPLVIVGGLAYLLLLTLMGAISRYFMQHHLWRTAIETMKIAGLESLANARKAGEASNALGEGMLEGLDMGGF